MSWRETRDNLFGRDTQYARLANPLNRTMPKLRSRSRKNRKGGSVFQARKEAGGLTPQARHLLSQLKAHLAGTLEEDIEIDFASINDTQSVFDIDLEGMQRLPRRDQVELFLALKLFEELPRRDQERLLLSFRNAGIRSAFCQAPTPRETPIRVRRVY